MNYLQLLFLLMIIQPTLVGQIELLKKDTFVDERDGKQYEILEVNDMLWFREDLKYATETAYQLIQDGKVIRFFYTNNQLDDLCPLPFRIPTAKEWEKAITELYDVKKVTYKKVRNNKSLIFKMKMKSSFIGSQKLNIQRTGWVEGGQHIEEGGTTYWLNEKGKKNYHLHFAAKAFSEHTHTHHIEDVEERRRQFLVRCVCEKNEFK